MLRSLRSVHLVLNSNLLTLSHSNSLLHSGYEGTQYFLVLIPSVDNGYGVEKFLKTQKSFLIRIFQDILFEE